MCIYINRSQCPLDLPVYCFSDAVLDLDNTEAFKDRIVRVVNETMPAAVDIDLTKACSATESGIAQLRRLRRDLHVVGCDLHLHCVAENVRATIDASGLTPMIDEIDSLKQWYTQS
jgi:anti-anti-sigma regulatory factor